VITWMQRRRRLRLSRAGVAVAVATAIAAPSALPQSQMFSVKSSLSGKTVLPHRIRWLGIAAGGTAKEVDFAIDGKLRWREHNAPYTFGNDGNYLVTSWLTPGAHRFTVTAIPVAGQSATVTTVARVAPSPKPPTGLAGAWTRIVSADEVAGAIDSPPGRWRLTIDGVGWRLRDPGGHGALVDVAYLAAGTLEARGGIYTKPPVRGDEGNIWCDDRFQPVRYRWSVTATTLTLSLAGPKRCDGQSGVWQGVWTRSQPR
jgi:hypothetical protein